MLIMISALYWAVKYALGPPSGRPQAGSQDEPSRAKTHPETVKILLAHGATITPEIRSMVEQRGNPEIIAILNQNRNF